jgi:hypothetical protein
VPPQMPVVLPGGIAQGRPGQQSEVEVHAPPLLTQVLPQTPPTHGLPQQSALVEQLVPSGGGFTLQSDAISRHRGMPSASWRQQSEPASAFELQ